MSDYTDDVQWAIGHACEAIKLAHGGSPNCAVGELTTALYWMKLAAETRNAERVADETKVAA